ncbi:cucurbitadienol 11-hydroxylase-like isoform X1 [Mercurialis annua]|uniref:cucurbitadienol 11-hydroxylase-like isoform X1 n=1 Tax=Mercurialis annua TaxID=3986 RepID=UPI00215F7FAC|nr:cucurbitadienol 11-hydroxylase-like isoform X1 [Mercurialis annua]
MTIGLVFGAILVIVLSYWIQKWRYPKCNGVLPPGSMGWPIIGETLELLIPSYSLELHPFIQKRINRYGLVFRTSVAGRPVICSADADFNHYIFSQEGKLVEQWYMDTFSDVFVLDGETRTNGATAYIHKYGRGLFLNHFGSQTLKQNLLPLIQDAVTKTLRSWSSQQSICVKRASSKAVYDLMAKLIFSYEVENSCDDSSEYLSTIMDGLMSFPVNIPGTRYHQCQKNKKKMMKMLKQVLTERRESIHKDGRNDLLNEALRDMQKENFLTEDLILNLMFAGLFAGFEGISTLLTLFFKFLSDHPLVLQELIVEHENILKYRDGSNTSVSWNEYKSMTFTLQVINETLRLANTTPGFLRRSKKDIQYKGYTIPAGWTIMVVTSACQMNPHIYEDPLVFNPWRWKDVDQQAISKNFAPFGGGNRQCAGAEYSRVFLSIFLHVLVTKYKWTTIKEAKIRRSPLLEFGDGVYIRLHTPS